MLERWKIRIISLALQDSTCRKLEGYVLHVTKETEEQNEQISVISLFIEHNEGFADFFLV